jgi:hypothetical protein
VVWVNANARDRPSFAEESQQQSVMAPDVEDMTFRLDEADS